MFLDDDEPNQWDDQDDFPFSRRPRPGGVPYVDDRVHYRARAGKIFPRPSEAPREFAARIGVKLGELSGGGAA